MMYATTMTDGSLALTEVVPSAIRFDGPLPDGAPLFDFLAAALGPGGGFPLRVAIVGSVALGDGVGLATAAGVVATHRAALRDLEADTLAPAVLEFPAMTDVAAKWHADAQAKVAQHHGAIDRASIPADRTFRAAWRHDGGAVTIDMAAARAAQKDRMRRVRAPLLAALDIAYQRADEQGDATAKADVAAKKQALRDVTADPAIAAAATPDALAAVWPAVLGAA